MIYARLACSDCINLVGVVAIRERSVLWFSDDVFLRASADVDGWTSHLGSSDPSSPKNMKSHEAKLIRQLFYYECKTNQ